MKNLIDQSGLIAGSDYLSLSRTVTMRGNYLVDDVALARHRVHRRAVRSVELLMNAVPFNLWMQYNSRRGLKEQEILDILLFLNEIGALVITRTAEGHKQIGLMRLKRLVVGTWPILRTKRWSSDPFSIGLAVLVTMQPLIIAVITTGIIAYGANFPTMPVTVFSISFLTAIWFSTAIHEWIHCLIVGSQNQSHVLLQRGLRLGILHKALPAKFELASAISGPIAGFVASWVSAIMIGLISDQLRLSLAAGLLVSLLQLASLLPFYGDGQ